MKRGKTLEVRLRKEPGQERVVGRLAEAESMVDEVTAVGRWPTHARDAGSEGRASQGIRKAIEGCQSRL